MLLPASSSVREAARRTQCMNNIKQLALGILNYESAHQTLPQAAGIKNRIGEALPTTTNRYSGFLSFFTFLERYSGEHSFDKEFEHAGVTYPAYPDVDTDGHPLWTVQRPYFLCPNLSESDTSFGSNHYAFSIGDIAKNIHAPQSIRGAFAVGRAQTLDEITDGLSSTVCLVEIGGSFDRGVGSRFAIDQPARYLEKPALSAELVDRRGQYLPDVALSSKRRGGNWADGSAGVGLVNTILPPGSPSLMVGGKSMADGFFSASQNHPDGTVVAFCDSSLHFISIDIDVGDQHHPASSAESLAGTASHYGVWGALGSANGDEEIEGKF